jgi:hypothetical protein
MDFNLVTVIGPTLTDTSANSNVRSWRDFVSLIRGLWRNGPYDFIAVGLLLAAKEELARDALAAMIKDKLDFDSSVGRKLMRIATNATLCAPGCNLPPNWTILHILAQLPEDVLKAALADGRIRSGMSRKDALALKPPKKPAPESTAAAAKTSLSAAPAELSAIWGKTPADQRQVFLDRIGCENLCAAMSNTLRADFHDRAVSLAGASPSSDFAIYSTDKLHAALHAAEQSEPDMERMAALLNCIIKRANTKGIARSDLVIATGKPKGRRR